MDQLDVFFSSDCLLEAISFELSVSLEPFSLFHHSV